MFCPECGSKNKDDALFCENCGTSLKSPQGNGAPLSAPVKKERQPLDGKEKLLLIEICVAVLSVILFFVIYNVQFGAKSVAEKHVEAMMERNYADLYDTIYLKDHDDFMSKEAFITAKKIQEPEDIEIADVDVTSVQKRSGGFTSQSIRVRYTKGSDSEKINLKLKRKGLFWKVQMDQGDYKDYGTKLVQKYSIAVPKGADVIVDKINVSDSLTPGKKIDGMDTYTLDAVFGAEHYVEISGKDVEKTGQLVSWTEGDPAIVQTDYNEKVVEELAKQGMEDWKIIMNALVNRKLFSQVDLLQNVDGTNKDAVIDEFESVRDYEFGGSSGDSEKINKYQFTNGVISLKRLLNHHFLRNWSSKMIKKSLEAYFLPKIQNCTFLKTFSKDGNILPRQSGYSVRSFSNRHKNPEKFKKVTLLPCKTASERWVK